MEFKKHHLSDLYTISSGLSKKREEFGFGYDFLTFKDVFHNIFIPEKLNELANTTDKERLKCSIKKGDVFLTRTSEKINELGLSSVALKDYPNATFNGFTKRLRPNKLCNEILLPKYAAFYYRSQFFREQITSFASMTTRASLNNEMISKLTIEIPPLSYQRMCINVLDSLLQKENLNYSIIHTLDQLSQTLFEQWFIDFEFPNEEGQPYKSSGGEMIESVVGKIPINWSISKIETIAQFKNGKKITSDDKDETGIYTLFGSNGVIGYTNKILYSSPSLIIGRVGANCGSMELSLDPCWISDNAIMCAPKNMIHYNFLYLLLKKMKLKEKAGGSAQPLINQSILKGLKFILPSESLMEKFHSIAYKNTQLTENLKKENEKLAKLRDTLLPKLFSGEIEIPEETEV